MHDRRSFIAGLVLFFLAVGLVLLLGPTPMPYLGFLRQGDEHAARAERSAAVTAYREAAHLHPTDPEPYLRLAQVYLDWGCTEEALAALAEAERLARPGGSLRPGRFLKPARSLQIAISVARADWPAVVVHAQRLLALAPEDRGAHLTLARAYLQLEEWERAWAEYELLLRADPADPLVHERLGALMIGDGPAAIQHLFAARTELAGRLLAALGEASVANDPAYTRMLVGRVLFEEREWALAAHQFERALAGAPDYSDAHAYLGHALDQMGRSEEARSHLLRAVELAPDSAVAHTFLGLHDDRLGDVSAARAEYEAAYDLDSQNAALCVEIGQTWAAEDRYVAAEIWLVQAVSLQPDDPALWEALARFYVDHQIAGGGRAVEAAARWVELAPGDARAQDVRGWAAFQAGDYGTARSSLLRAIALDPTLAVAHYHLGRLWAAEGAAEQAQEAFARALDLDTTGELAPLVEIPRCARNDNLSGR